MRSWWWSVLPRFTVATGLVLLFSAGAAVAAMLGLSAGDAEAHRPGYPPYPAGCAAGDLGYGYGYGGRYGPGYRHRRRSGYPLDARGGPVPSDVPPSVLIPSAPIPSGPCGVAVAPRGSARPAATHEARSPVVARTRPALRSAPVLMPAAPVTAPAAVVPSPRPGGTTPRWPPRPVPARLRAHRAPVLDVRFVPMVIAGAMVAAIVAVRSARGVRRR